MPVTAADVHNVAFSKPRIGKRGYDAADVDALLDEAERELVRLVEENNDLHARRQHGGRGGTPAGPSADARLAAELGELRAQLNRLERDKAVAEQVARAMRAELEQMRAQDGSSVDGDAEQQALRVLTIAQRTADDHVGDAQREADKLLADARSTAQEVTSRARATADALGRDARQRHQEAMASLDGKRTAAQRHIEELKEFERGYRTRLTAYLDSQLRELGGQGRRPGTETAPADSDQSASSPGGMAAPTPAVDSVPGQ